MGRRKLSVALDVLMNGEHVGKLIRNSSGKLEFTYSDEWTVSGRSRPISLSIPVIQKRHSGIIVENFFSNLLPDSTDLLQRLYARFGIDGNNKFGLLSLIGRDCIGALQLLPEGMTSIDVQNVNAKPLSEKDVAALLRDYRISPLGMSRNTDFRISIAGAQEKTALLRYKKRWCLPNGTTPTSHIFKLPIGLIEHANIDLSDSVENEWLCSQLLKAFGIPVPEMEMSRFEDINVLIVERFDRKWASDGSWLMRLPQEDMCQALGISSALKYESDGGPGIQSIMDILQGSSYALSDRRMFMKTVFIFWLIGAIDGHGKNFSIFLNPHGEYRMTPIYDVMSVYPLIAKKQIARQKIKMAMSVRGSSKHYEWSKIQLRHWISTAKSCYFPESSMSDIISETIGAIEKVISDTHAQLPKSFPSTISDPIFSYLSQMKSK